MEWLRDYTKRRLDYKESVCAGIRFGCLPFWSGEGKERRSVSFYRPNPYRRNDDVLEGLFDIADLTQAQKEAPLLRKAILDELLPVEIENLSGGGICHPGRYWDIVLLGMIRYAPALTELVEAAQHDLHKEIRNESLSSIGQMSEKAYAYAAPIAKILSSDRSLWVRREAAEVLGKLKNKRVIPQLRETVEESRLLTKTSFELGYFSERDTEKRDLCHQNASLFEKALISLFQLDCKQGKEEIKKSFNYGCPLVAHHTKNAVFWTGEKRIVFLPDEMFEDIKLIDMPFQVSSSRLSYDEPVF